MSARNADKNSIRAFGLLCSRCISEATDASNVQNADAKAFVRLQEIKKNEGAQTFRKGRFDSFQTAGGDAVGLKRKENSDLCGGRQGLRPLTPQAFEKA